MPTLSANTIKWTLFCVLATTVPVPYFMFVIAGLLPLVAVVYMCFAGAVWGLVLFNAVHLLIWGLIFYWVSKKLAHYICQRSASTSAVSLLAIILVLAVVPFLPVYGVGHSEYQPVNILQLFKRYL